MNIALSWLTVFGFIVIIVAIALIGTTLIDWFVERVSNDQAQKDVDQLFRQDRARDVMRSWVEVDEVDGEAVPLVWQEFDNRPEQP